MLVTVQGPEQRVELQLPGDRPIGELIPLLIEVCAKGRPTEGAKWELAQLGGLAFDSAKTLVQVGVVDGARLHLRDVAAPPPSFELTPAAEAHTVTAAPVPVSYDNLLPQDRTRLALPARVPVIERVRGAAEAALNLAPPAPRPDPIGPSNLGQIVNPNGLVAGRGPGLRNRVRASWRATDYLSRLEDAIIAPQLRRCATIAVMSPKGGVGKTTTTVLLGTLLALLRRDRVVAIDTNPDFGSLGRQLAPLHTVFVDDLYEVLDEPELTATALDTHLCRVAHGLMVIPAPTDPVRVSQLDTDAYVRVVRKLQQMVGVIVLDTGTGFHEPAARAALATADQVVLVSDPEPSTASLVAEAAGVLRPDGLPIWLLVNKSGIPTDLDVRAFGAVVPHAWGLTEVPNNLAAARTVAAGSFDWRDAPRGWKRSVRELSASLVADWAQLGIATG